VGAIIGFITKPELCLRNREWPQKQRVFNKHLQPLSRAVLISEVQSDRIKQQKNAKCKRKKPYKPHEATLA